MSPGLSFGVNENGWPHFGQKPSERPAAPSRLRPTGCPSTAQKRLLSGTTGLSRIASAGSCSGMGGMTVNPPPSRLRAALVALVVRRFEPRVPLPVEPSPATEAGPPAGGCPRPETGVVAAVECEPGRVLTFMPVTVQYPSESIS